MENACQTPQHNLGSCGNCIRAVAHRPPSKKIGKMILMKSNDCNDSWKGAIHAFQRSLRSASSISLGVYFSCNGGNFVAFASGDPSSGFSGSGGGGGGGSGTLALKRKSPVVITLAAYAVARYAYEKITNLFSKYWLEKTGQKVKFRLSIGGSGAQARAVIDGLPADIVSLALPLDVIKIENAGLIKKGWQNRAPNNSVPAETTVCIALRPGNPKNIHEWTDLSRSDLSVVMCNPKTAGVARWSFLALWGGLTLGERKSEEETVNFLESVFQNVPVQPRDGREASDVFIHQEIGDALVTYENEIIVANQKILESGRGEEMVVVIPKVDVKVETVIAVVDVNAERNGVKDICEEFVAYTFREEAQRVFVEAGFRPFLKQFDRETKSNKVDKVWRVEESLGDWEHLQRKFFDNGGVMDEVESRLGKSRA